MVQCSIRGLPGPKVRRSSQAASRKRRRRETMVEQLETMQKFSRMSVERDLTTQPGPRPGFFRGAKTDDQPYRVGVADCCRVAQAKIAVPPTASVDIIRPSETTPAPNRDRTKLLSAPAAIIANPWRDAAAPAIVGNGATAPAMAFGITIPMDMSQII